MHLMALLLVAAAVTAVWSLFATRLTHLRVAPALVLAIAGAATAQVSKVELSTALALPITERIIEMILALLLFVDATEVKGGLLGHDRRGALKLLLIGLPLSLVAATALGAFLFPGAAYGHPPPLFRPVISPPPHTYSPSISHTQEEWYH